MTEIKIKEIAHQSSRAGFVNPECPQAQAEDHEAPDDKEKQSQCLQQGSPWGPRLRGQVGIGATECPQINSTCSA
jgi:hypothetical protein